MHTSPQEYRSMLQHVQRHRKTLEKFISILEDLREQAPVNFSHPQRFNYEKDYPFRTSFSHRFTYPVKKPDYDLPPSPSSDTEQNFADHARLKQALDIYSSWSRRKRSDPIQVLDLLRDYSLDLNTLRKFPYFYQHQFISVTDDPRISLEHVPVPASPGETTTLIYPSNGTFCKIKERTLKKAVYEAFMLHVWHNLLHSYDSEAPSRVVSPQPLGVSYDTNRFKSHLFMEYIKGIGLHKLLAKQKNPDVPAVLEEAIYHAGIVCGIKHHEKLLHGDFALRHLLFFQNGRSSQIGVIDLEKSRIGTAQEAEAENQHLLNLYLQKYSCHADQPSLRTAYHEGIASTRNLDALSHIIERSLKEFKEQFQLPLLKIDPTRAELNLGASLKQQAS